MSNPQPSRLSLRVVPSPFLLAGSLGMLALLTLLALGGGPAPAADPLSRAAVLAPLMVLAVLLTLDSILRVEIEQEGIRVVSLAALLLGRIFRGAPASRRNFRLPWSSVDAVELRISRFQSPFRRHYPRGWLLAGASGRVVRIPLGHPRFSTALDLLRRSIHPYFLRLPCRGWEGKIPGRTALERMLRTVIFDPSTPPEFIAETARASLLWGHFSRAERLMDLALAKEEGDERVLDDYFQMMRRLGRTAKAKPALEKLLRLRGSPMDLVEMAEVHHAEGDDKSATECLLQAAEREPASDLAHFLLGCLYVQREGLEATALDQWKKGLDRARHPQLLGKIGEAYRYHRELLTSPEFFLAERRRQRLGGWANRAALAGSLLVLSGVTWWWARPAADGAIPAGSGLAVLIGGGLMLAAILLRRRARR